MYMLYRPDIEKYLTIHEDDKSNFFKIVEGNVFETENKFQLITKPEDMKEVLDTHFSSKNRTEEYESGLPSATVINSLFPQCLDMNKKSNQVSLLRWFNDKTKEEYFAQQRENKVSTDSGTVLHKVLELALTDNVRMFKRTRKLNDYIEQALEDQEIIDMIKNFEERKDDFRNMSKNALSKFFENEIRYIDPVFNELFVNIGCIQGAIDLVFYKDKQLYIGDFKSSKKSASREQLISKGYLRQLYVYSIMLKEAGIITKKEFDKLQFEIFFFQWNSGRSRTEYFSKQEVDDESELYVKYILKWYWQIKGVDKNLDGFSRN